MIKKVPDDGYVRCCNAMLRAARAWVREHPAVCLDFAALPERIFFIADLGDAVPWFGTTEPSRELLREMYRASNNLGTLAMARVVLDVLFESKAKA